MIKRAQLKDTTQKTGNILSTENPEAIDRHQAALKVVSGEVEHWKRSVEAIKIGAEIPFEQITTWSATIDQDLAAADQEVVKLKKWVEDKRLEKKAAQREDLMCFEVKLQELKAKTQLEAAQESEEAEGHPVKTEVLSAKLPKITIAQFKGSHLDWPRFWGQFTETIDKRPVAPIQKFAYLCGYLSPKVKQIVEALPFTTEGYNRAKAILKDKYGKDSEVVKAYIKEILDLPHIPTAHVRKIHEFGNKL